MRALSRLNNIIPKHFILLSSIRHMFSCTLKIGAPFYWALISRLKQKYSADKHGLEDLCVAYTNCLATIWPDQIDLLVHKSQWLSHGLVLYGAVV